MPNKRVWECIVCGSDCGAARRTIPNDSRLLAALTKRVPLKGGKQWKSGAFICATHFLNHEKNQRLNRRKSEPWLSVYFDKNRGLNLLDCSHFRAGNTSRTVRSVNRLRAKEDEK